MSGPNNLALFIDGTWNRPSRSEPTNVYKLFRACCGGASDKEPQLAYYLPGVGYDIRQRRASEAVGCYGGEWASAREAQHEPPRALGARWLLGGVFGVGTTARIKEAYTFLSRHFVRARGDRIYIFGFSRGAFAARSLAGFVFRVGTLLADKLHLVEAAYAVYESGQDPNDTLLANFLQSVVEVQMLRHGDDPAAMPLHFVGLWDTVAALGLPERVPIFTADRTERHQQTPPLNVLAARHALALHELRADYKPEIWVDDGHANLQQVWFAGAHADVGGGFALDESGLSNIALQWMADEGQARGLRLDVDLLNEYLAVGDASVHNSISGKFRWFEPTPREALMAMSAHEQPHAAEASSRNVLYFHKSVSRYLDEHGGSAGRGWPKGAGIEKVGVDAQALKMYILNRLQGDEPRGRA